MRNRYAFRVRHVKGQRWRPAWQIVVGARAEARRRGARRTINHVKERIVLRVQTAGPYRYWRGLFELKGA